MTEGVNEKGGTMRRILLVLTALTIPVSVVAVTFGGTASAKGKAEKSITCKTFSGSVSGTVTMSQCNGNTGGSSQGLNATALATGGTINWSNGTSTTVGSPTLGSVSNKKCKASGDVAESVSMTVTADTTGLGSLGTLTTQVCVANGNISALKPVKIT